MSAPPRRDIARAILSLSASVSTERLVRSVAAYLVRERRTSDLDAIMRDIVSVRAVSGTVEVTATSAFVLAEAVKRDIARLFDQDKLVINEIVDPNVIGGVRLETSENMLDLTVQGQLKKLRRGVKQPV